MISALLLAAALTAQQLEPLWVEPTDIETRDLFHGVGGKQRAPKEGEGFRFESKETKGHSDGYYVHDANGRKWKVKTGDEAQSEVAVSRILWAIGYHQPALYFVSEWKMKGGPDDELEPGRFRLVSEHDSKDPWAFDDNPFVGTRELNGLIAANLLVNNWDLAASNNRIYEVDGEIRYVVQDVGGALGKTRWPIGTRNDIDDFESQEFVRGVKDGRVKFDYHAHRRKLLGAIRPEDVAWVCGLLSRLSDQQLADAFRGAGYPDAVGKRYVAKIKAKIAQGRALAR